MKIQRSKKGFTLVEIMIVVVIIGLLAAMAIPAFQKVRRTSMAKAMANDARQIGAALQQMQLEYPAYFTVGVNYDVVIAADGSLTGANVNTAANPVTIANYVAKISRGTSAGATVTYTTGTASGVVAFSLTNGQVRPADVQPGSTVNVSSTDGAAVQFDSEGKAL